ncbi:hypothetical protein [Ferruginibacter albus]|uniref:hypothetical protein n=1 Tax=Ferruginibacter albus TaxID=2875540 RepID=UPI001CC63562|nr:hypothetical protein [Ferruginibacter albus]UAY51720.1 hypothetical protein K9M53_14130 [Ferruginibacter albus]
MKKLFFLSVITIAILSACNKTDDFSPVSLGDYNLQTPGKYIIYQLDSISYANNGIPQTISYFAKDVVDSVPITDTLGRTGYRIYHYIKKNESDEWQPDNTFFTIPTKSNIEFIADNLRYIKLAAPMTEGFSWKGNAYIDTKTQTQTVTTPGVADWDLSYMDDWDYMYSNVNQPATVGNLSFDSTVTVNERDEVSGDTTDVSYYSEVTHSVEQYAKGVGLVYRNFVHRIWQPGLGAYESTSYGITLTIIDHN